MPVRGSRRTTELSARNTGRAKLTPSRSGTNRLAAAGVAHSSTGISISSAAMRCGACTACVQRHVGAERHAAHRSARDVQLVEERDHLPRVAVHAVLGRVLRLVAGPVAEQIEQHHAKVVRGERACQLAVDARVEQEPVGEHHHAIACAVDLVAEPVSVMGEAGPVWLGPCAHFNRSGAISHPHRDAREARPTVRRAPGGGMGRCSKRVVRLAIAQHVQRQVVDGDDALRVALGQARVRHPASVDDVHRAGAHHAPSRFILDDERRILVDADAQVVRFCATAARSRPMRPRSGEMRVDHHARSRPSPCAMPSLSTRKDASLAPEMSIVSGTAAAPALVPAITPPASWISSMRRNTGVPADLARDAQLIAAREEDAARAVESSPGWRRRRRPHASGCRAARRSWRRDPRTSAM
jgi:hypothetical protein